MWILSKQAKQIALAHSELELLMVERASELQALSKRLLQVQDEERRKLSRDLHDTTGQTLAALKMSVSFLHETCQRDPASRAIASDVLALADQAIREIRTMSYLLHPPLLDEVRFHVCGRMVRRGLCQRGAEST